MNEEMVVSGLSVVQSKEMLDSISRQLMSNEEFLGEIDRKIGDGDHGIGMANGAKAISDTVNTDEMLEHSELFSQAGMAMMESMGGASGVIFSAIFLGIAKAMKNKDQLTTKILAAGIQNAVATIQKRGKAQVGDKTMLDALVPAVTVLEKKQNEPLVLALSAASKAAYDGVEKTKNYSAKFGRAKFLGERSIGYQDAGATSVAIIFEAMSDYVKENVQ